MPKTYKKILFSLVAILFSVCCVWAQNEDIAVDELPYFAGCDAYAAQSKEKRSCSLSNLAYFLNRNLIYPDSAKQSGISGTVYVSFLVEKTGKISDIKILNDIGGGCGEVAKKVIEKMPYWEPATFKKQAIDYELRLPIKFQLENSGNYAQEFNLQWGDIRYDEISTATLENYSKQPLVVRNLSGEMVTTPYTLMMVYEYEKSIKTAKSKGEINKNMQKILKKAKPNSKITFMATLQKKGSFFEIYRTYVVKEF